MGELLSYSLNVAIILLPIYLIYKWLLSYETFHSFNRGVILLGYAIALLSLPIGEFIESLERINIVGTLPVIKIGELSEAKIETTPWYLVALLYVYLLGCFVMIMRLGYVWIKILHIIIRGIKRPIGMYTLVITDDNNIAPFSWLRYVVMSRRDYEQAGDVIITHELQHLRCQHWMDLLVAEIVLILNWFNPAAWLMKDEMKTVHEYQADMSVLSSGIDAKSYQILLIKKAVGARFPSLANSLNHSKLKKRITMMLSKQSSKSRRLRALTMVPVVAAALLVINQPSVAGTLSEIKNCELSASDSNKGSKKSSTITIQSNVVKSSLLENLDLKGKAVKYYYNGKEISKEQLSDIDVSNANVNVDHLDDAVVVGISTADSKMQVGDVVVINGGEGASTNMKDVKIYVNGKEVSQGEFKTINANDIAAMKIDKTSGEKVIYITLK